jgi:hypothetical protein
MTVVYYEPFSQSSVFRKIITQNVCNCVQNYKVMPHFTDDELGKKVKFSLEQATKAQRGSTGIALLFL